MRSNNFKITLHFRKVFFKLTQFIQLFDDPKSAIEQRIRLLKTVCDKYRSLSRYSDRRKVGHGNLFDEVKDRSANYIQNIAFGLPINIHFYFSSKC